MEGVGGSCRGRRMKDLVIWSVGNMSEGPISRIHGAALREEGDTTCLGRNSLDVVENVERVFSLGICNYKDHHHHTGNQNCSLEIMPCHSTNLKLLCNFSE